MGEIGIDGRCDPSKLRQFLFQVRTDGTLPEFSNRLPAEYKWFKRLEKTMTGAEKIKDIYKTMRNAAFVLERE